MGLVDIINSFPDTATHEEVAAAVEEYANGKSAEEIRGELPRGKINFKKEFSEKIQKHNLQYLIFQLATGIVSREQITQRGEGNIPGYSSFTGLASLFVGEKVNMSDVAEFFEKFAEDNNMPLLKQEHQDYIDNFSIDYVKSISKEQLHKKIPAGKSVVINPESGNYSLFLYELSQKISQDSKLQFELFKKWTGINVQEEIQFLNKEGTRGYSSFGGLMALLVGRHISRNEMKEYLEKLLHEHGMPILTQEHIDYISNFDVGYIRKTERDQLFKELPTKSCKSIDPNNKKTYSPFLHEIYKKISQDSKLQFELFKKWTAINAQEEIHFKWDDDKLGIVSISGLTMIMTGKSMACKERKFFFKTLAERHNMPLLTQEHQNYVDNFSLDYVRKTSKEQLNQEIPTGSGFTISPLANSYSLFLDELSKKISQDSELQLELFKKMTGITTSEQVILKDDRGRPHYKLFKGLAAVLVGKIMTRPQTREYLLSLFGEHSQKDDEYYELRSRLTELKRNNKGNGAAKSTNKNPFSGFGKCFEHYVGILLALENKDVEHQYKIDTENSFRIVDFYMDAKKYISLEELDEFIEVKSGVTMAPHDKAQLKDFLAQQNGITYIVHDIESQLANAIKEIADEEGKDITILPYDNLSSVTITSETDIANLFSDKEQFKEYIQTRDKNKLEADLFSVYLWIKETGDKGDLIHILNAVYSQNQEDKESFRDTHNINWLSINEYRRKSLEVFSKEKGRHFDLELAKKKLRTNIMNLEREVVNVEEETQGEYTIQRFYVSGKIIGEAHLLNHDPYPDDMHIIS